jgi:hypothetical protein
MVAFQDHSPATILSALETNLSVLWRSYSRMPAAELCDRPDLFWVATDIPLNQCKISARFAHGNECASPVAPDQRPAWAARDEAPG